MTRSNTKEEFVINAQKIHQNRYDYSKSIYKGSDTKIEIICSIHGSFWQTPNKHIYAHQNCPKCNLSQKITLEMFLEKANNIHKNKYDYSFITEINGYNSKITIICQIHKKFFQSVQKHLFGRGCPRCGGSIKSTKEEFIEKANIIHNNQYDYSNIDYKNNKTKIEIKCLEHGFFTQTPTNHLSGQSCPNCKSSKNEKLTNIFLKEILTNINSNIILETPKLFIFNDCNIKKRILVDFYFEINDKKYIIEYNGHQHYRPVRFGGISQKEAEEKFKKQQTRDELLRNYCKENNINLLEIDGRKYQNNKIKIFLQEKLNELFLP